MKQITALLILLLLLGIQLCTAQNRQVTGKVTDQADKSSLPGVTIMIKGTTTGVSTDIDGNYVISAAKGQVLVFSFIGMTNREITVGDQNVINVQLESASQAIDEVIVIGYGVRKKGSITGSVSTIKSDKLENTPVASFDQALQGQAPGLQISSNSGQPNAESTFQLRGVNSMTAGTTPLFIMDGMQVTAGDFSSLNPSDIENISVLKDASSTAIYGARATNGVIIITTKRGKIGEKARITVRGQAGVSSLAFGKWDLMNTHEKLDYEEEIGLHANETGYNRADWEGTNVDWRDIVFNNHALVQNYELSISGATPKTNYYFSGGYHDQEGITYATYFKRYTVRLNLNTQANNWLKMGVNMTAAYEDYRTSYEGAYDVSPLGSVTTMNNYWNPYNPDGSVASIGDGTWKGVGQNPIEMINSKTDKDNEAKIIASAFLEATPIQGLTLKTLGGVNFSDLRSKVTDSPDYAPNQGEGHVYETLSRRYALTITNTADYARTVNSIHNLRFLLGHEANYQMGDGFGIEGRGIKDQRLLELSSATAYDGYSISPKTESTFLSFFGRAEYNYDEKYFIDATFRRDGSSKFGANSKWGNFWSAGIMWNLMKESFLQDNTLLTNAQLSYSIGTQGNSSIPDYQHLATVLGGGAYDGQSGFQLYTIGNPNLTWEKTNTMNWGVKVSFLNRIHLSMDAYHKVTTDMLLIVPYSFSSGFSSGYDNIGKMTNNGFEVDLNVDAIRTTDFNWNISTNFSYNKNKIIELYEDRDEYINSGTGLRNKVGRPYGEFYLNRFAGVNPSNGDALYYTKDGGIINTLRAEDQVATGKTFFAPWSGGFATSLSYKGISLSAQFSWTSGRYMINNDRYFTESNGKFSNLNQSRTLLYDRWKKPGDIAKVPRHGINMNSNDDRLLEDASYLRMKNLSLSYSLPQSWLKRTNFFESVKIYGQAQNLFTVTGFKGLDPEFSSNIYAATYPVSRQFTFGIEVNL